MIEIDGVELRTAIALALGGGPDLRAYYDALNVQKDEAQERAGRAEVRAMAERRLAHMDARDGFEYNPTPSPLQSYMQER